MKLSLGGGYTLSVHEEGRVFVVIMALLCLGSLIFGLSYLTILFAILCISCAAFFRDPVRVTPVVHNAVISPADGTILSISNSMPPVESSLDHSESMLKISIFLSMFDVHVNYIPVRGRIIEVHYIPGKFAHASLDKSSVHNERNIVVIETESEQKIICVQIAGLVARRIVSNLSPGQFVAVGDKYGIIRFGSRVDLYLPKSAKLKVLTGQTMIAGETIIGELAD